MIVESILNLFFSFIKLLISLLPNINLQNVDLSGFINILSSAFSFLPSGFPLVFFSSVAFWKSSSLIWACIEWVYKKIPGVD